MKLNCKLNPGGNAYPLYDAIIEVDAVGKPFKDTSSVAMNPVIKFSTLFGLLAMEITILAAFLPVAPYVASHSCWLRLFLYGAPAIKCRLKNN